MAEWPIILVLLAGAAGVAGPVAAVPQKTGTPRATVEVVENGDQKLGQKNAATRSLAPASTSRTLSPATRDSLVGNRRFGLPTAIGSSASMPVTGTLRRRRHRSTRPRIARRIAKWGSRPTSTHPPAAERCSLARSMRDVRGASPRRSSPRRPTIATRHSCNWTLAQFYVLSSVTLSRSRRARRRRCGEHCNLLHSHAGVSGPFRSRFAARAELLVSMLNST